jgi:hypothetical protein
MTPFPDEILRKKRCTRASNILFLLSGVQYRKQPHVQW